MSAEAYARNIQHRPWDISTFSTPRPKLRYTRVFAKQQPQIINYSFQGLSKTNPL